MNPHRSTPSTWEKSTGAGRMGGAAHTSTHHSPVTLITVHSQFPCMSEPMRKTLDTAQADRSALSHAPYGI